MRAKSALWRAIGLMLIAATTAKAQNPPIAFVGAKLIPVDGPEISRGALVIADGKFVSIGAIDQVAIPPNATRVDVTGRIIMPGLVDTHNHIGGIGGGDSSAPLQPDVRILDSLNVLDSGYVRARAGGLTTLNIMPGSGHLLSGQTVYVKPRKAETIDDFFIRDADGRTTGGIKMANGTNSMSGAPFPGTRGKSAALVRDLYIKAQQYRDKIRAANGDAAKLPARDLGMEILIDALEGRRIVHHHTHRHDDIETVLRLSKEFGFRVVLHHVSEAWMVADEIAAANVPCSAILVDSPGGKLEATNLVYETGAVLEKAGVKVAFHTDDWITDVRLFRRMAALAVRAGMSREGALRALTLSGAEMLDLGDRIGSLTPGKDADFAILDGDPFSVYTNTLETWIDGRRVFSLDNPDDHLHAVGGFGAGRDQTPYLCCAQEEHN